MKDLTLGMLAHVDAGKTTLSEALLYTCGTIKQMGRVDHRNAFLDTGYMERDRGITIYSKQAVFNADGLRITLLDTPGHADFSAEMERVLQVLDYAVLVISGTDGVQSHTRTLWDLLDTYGIPVFIFVNKMDQPDNDRAEVMKKLKKDLSSSCADFSETGSDEWLEDISLCDEDMLERFLERGDIPEKDIVNAIKKRQLFPCCFGSALKLEGIKEFVDTLVRFAVPDDRPREFGARAFKISHDETGLRLTHLKITGGTLSVRDVLSGTDKNGDEWKEKVSRIRLYNGSRYKEVSSVPAGTVCAVAGLSRSGQYSGFGFEKDRGDPVLQPILSYKLELPPETDARQFYRELMKLEDEEPELHFIWSEAAEEISAQVMGDIHMEILTSEILDRFGVQIGFTNGSVMYKETIAAPVEGVGHFEPLRHYAEVHLILEPLPRGSGIQLTTGVSEDILSRNWQRLIMTHLAERSYPGVLTGSPITDIKITLAAGRAHAKHTSGGDFRQAVYRAVRQGLMEAESILLEPYYNYTLTLPSGYVGRAMTDLDNLGASQGEIAQDEVSAILTGSAPVSAIRNYQKEVTSYTKGEGSLSLAFAGYDRCGNAGEVIAAACYDPVSDPENSPDSVFCTHGSGYIVPWYEVKEYMHLPSVLAPAAEYDEETAPAGRETASGSGELWISPEEVEQIINRTYYSNKKEDRRGGFRKKIKKEPAFITPDTDHVDIRHSDLEKYLLIDGYNLIFAWDELAVMAQADIDAARGRLLDILVNYRSMTDSEIIAVFDAYRVRNHPVTLYDYGTIHVVFTETAQTADAYIEKFVHDNKNRYDITVVTSDGLEQIIIRGQNAGLISSHEFEGMVHSVNKRIRSMIDDHNRTAPRNRMDLSAVRAQLENNEKRS